MKKIFIAIVSLLVTATVFLFPLTTVCQIKDIRLLNNNLEALEGREWRFKGTVSLPTSISLDENNNWVVKKSDQIYVDEFSTGNIVWCFRSAGVKNSHNNFIWGENDSVINSVNNSIRATDSKITNSSYSDIHGDAIWANVESSSIRGFGHVAIGYHLDIYGSNNTIGTWIGHTGGSKRISNSSAGGVGVKVNSSNTHARGVGFNAPIEGGFGYGNGTIKFWVYPDGRISLNGLMWPVSQPQVGDQLVFLGNGQLGWSSQLQSTSKSLPEIPSHFRVSYLNGQQTAILIPVYGR